MYKITNVETFRLNIRKKIFEIMNIDGLEFEISGNIEKGIFNYAIEKATKNNIIKKSLFRQLRSMYI